MITDQPAGRVSDRNNGPRACSAVPTALGLVVLLGTTSSSSAASSQYGFLTLTSALALVVPLKAATAPRHPQLRSATEISVAKLGLVSHRETARRWDWGPSLSSSALPSGKQPLVPVRFEGAHRTDVRLGIEMVGSYGDKWPEQPVGELTSSSLVEPGKDSVRTTTVVEIGPLVS